MFGSALQSCPHSPQFLGSVERLELHASGLPSSRPASPSEALSGGIEASNSETASNSKTASDSETASDFELVSGA
jgi:hypothetical protein